MKYCSHCGKDLLDEAVICPSCGCRVDSTTATKAEENKIISLLIKVFMVIGCIATGWSLIPLIWKIPMTVHVFKCLDKKEPMGVGFKVCVLLFCNLIAGILLLCKDSLQD